MSSHSHTFVGPVFFSFAGALPYTVSLFLPSLAGVQSLSCVQPQHTYTHTHAKAKLPLPIGYAKRAVISFQHCGIACSAFFFASGIAKTPLGKKNVLLRNMFTSLPKSILKRSCLCPGSSLGEERGGGGKDLPRIPIRIGENSTEILVSPY